jgi:hypothetical protein
MDRQRVIQWSVGRDERSLPEAGTPTAVTIFTVVDAPGSMPPCDLDGLVQE